MLLYANNMMHLILHTAVLLLIYNSVVSRAADAQRCIFNDVMRKSGTPVNIVREVPSAKDQQYQHTYIVSSSGKWEPIRINISSLDLDDNQKSCSIFERRKSYITGSEFSCRYNDAMSMDKKNTLLNQILPVAIQLHSDRLLVKRLNTAFKVPDLRRTVCSHFTVPRDHTNEGVQDTDMLLYVAAGPSEDPNDIWAVPCAVLEDGRPVVAAMNFVAKNIVFERSVVRVTAHVIGHALGFSYERMRALKMTATRVNKRKNKKAVVVNSTKTKETVKKYFDCESLEGMELEDGYNEDDHSHWNRRVARDELMSTWNFNEAGMYYSALTMSAFEDMKYYQVRWGMEETMSWGNKSGCDLLYKKCQEASGVHFLPLYCERSKVGCTADRTGLGYCRNVHNLDDAVTMNPWLRQFFPDYNSISFSLSERDEKCFSIQSSTSCITKLSELLRGADTGVQSWCLDGESLIVQEYGIQKNVSGACVAVKCEGNSFSIQYQKNGQWHLCSDGKTIKAKGGKYVSGGIKCPKYHEVCTIAANGSSLIDSKMIE